jgi:hypothetical protein
MSQMKHSSVSRRAVNLKFYPQDVEDTAMTPVVDNCVARLSCTTVNVEGKVA